MTLACTMQASTQIVTSSDTAVTRVASLHLCADEWLLTLAAHEQILALTWLARDESLTAMAQAAHAYPSHRGGAEALIAMAPDLVINVRGASPDTVALLRRFGVRVHEFDIPARVRDIEPTLTALGAVLRRDDAAQRAIEEFRAQLAQAQRQNGARRRAAVYEPRGYSSGADSLIHDVLTLAGLDNVVAMAGHSGYRYLSLEGLIASDPQVLVIGSTDPRRPSLAEDLLTHPLLERLLRSEGVTVVPPQPWSCGTPAVGAAVTTLANAGNSR